MSSDRVTEIKKEAIKSEVQSQPIEHQGIMEETAHIAGRLAGAAKNTAVAAKDAVVHAGEFTKEKAIAAKDYVLGKEYEKEHLGDKNMPRDATMDSGFHSSLDQGFTTEKKDVQDVLKTGETNWEKRDLGMSSTGGHDWFKDTGVDKKEVMEERRHVIGSGLSSTDIDKRVGLGEKPYLSGQDTGKRDFSTAFHDTGSSTFHDVQSGAFHDTGSSTFHDAQSGGHRDWFKDTGVDKQEVMEERRQVIGSGVSSTDIDKRIGLGEKTDFGNANAGLRDNYQGALSATDKKISQGLEHGDKHHDWFQDTGVDKKEVMEERRAVLGERSDTVKERFDNTSNTLANKAGQLKDTVLEKGSQLKDAALEKGGQLKDAALEKGAQLKDAAMQKGGQWKDAALEKGGQWKDTAADKAYSLKDSAMDKSQQLTQQAKEGALETGDNLKAKAIDAGNAAQEKGIAMKAASEKGFVQQEARADKENVNVYEKHETRVDKENLRY